MCKIISNLGKLFKEISGTVTTDGIEPLTLTSMEIALNVPSGYKIHSVKQLYITGWSGLVYQGHRISSNKITFQIYSTHNVVRPCTVNATINCIKII